VRSLPQAGQRGRSGGAGAERTGPKPDAPARQIKYLNRDIAGLYRKLDRAELVIDLQKNVYRDRVWRNHSIAFVVQHAAAAARRQPSEGERAFVSRLSAAAL
jgi:hypothetical protein